MKTIVKEILTSLRATLVFAVVLCGIFPLVIFGCRTVVLSSSSQWKSHRKQGPPDSRFGTSRTEFRRREILPPATLRRRRQWLRRRQLQRLEPGAHFPEIDGFGKAAGRKNIARKTTSPPTHWFLGMQSPLAAAVSIRTSAQRTRSFKLRAWPKNAGLASTP